MKLQSHSQCKNWSLTTFLPCTSPRSFYILICYEDPENMAKKAANPRGYICFQYFSDFYNWKSAQNFQVRVPGSSSSASTFKLAGPHDRRNSEIRKSSCPNVKRLECSIHCDLTVNYRSLRKKRSEHFRSCKHTVFRFQFSGECVQLYIRTLLASHNKNRYRYTFLLVKGMRSFNWLHYNVHQQATIPS